MEANKHEMNRFTLPLLALSALAACATVDARTPALAGTAVPLDQPVAVGNLVATPLAVVEDSRCPINARCVRAGDLIVSTRITGNGWTETAPLKLGEPHATHGNTIMLSSGEPGRMAGTAQTAPRDYRFTFE